MSSFESVLDACFLIDVTVSFSVDIQSKQRVSVILGALINAKPETIASNLIEFVKNFSYFSEHL